MHEETPQLPPNVIADRELAHTLALAGHDIEARNAQLRTHIAGTSEYKSLGDTYTARQMGHLAIDAQRALKRGERDVDTLYKSVEHSYNELQGTKRKANEKHLIKNIEDAHAWAIGADEFESASAKLRQEQLRKLQGAQIRRRIFSQTTTSEDAHKAVLHIRNNNRFSDYRGHTAMTKSRRK